MHKHVHSPTPVSKGTALGEGTPPTPLFTGVWQKPGTPVLDALGLWKAEASCAVLARSPVDAGTVETACPWCSVILCPGRKPVPPSLGLGWGYIPLHLTDVREVEARRLPIDIQGAGGSPEVVTKKGTGEGWPFFPTVATQSGQAGVTESLSPSEAGGCHLLLSLYCHHEEGGHSSLISMVQGIPPQLSYSRQKSEVQGHSSVSLSSTSLWSPRVV